MLTEIYPQYRRLTCPLRSVFVCIHCGPIVAILESHGVLCMFCHFRASQ